MTRHNIIGIFRVTSMFFFLFVNFLSFGYVAWKTVQCISKYNENPKGTELSIQKSSNRTLFPAITICALDSTNKWNQTKLQDCNITQSE